jgi:hypothetical protein
MQNEQIFDELLLSVIEFSTYFFSFFFLTSNELNDITSLEEWEELFPSLSPSFTYFSLEQKIGLTG